MSIARVGLPKFKLIYTDDQSVQTITPKAGELYVYLIKDQVGDEVAVKYFDVAEKSPIKKSLPLQEVEAIFKKNNIAIPTNTNATNSSASTELSKGMGMDEEAAVKIAYLFNLNIVDVSTREKMLISTLDLLTKQFNQQLYNEKELSAKTAQDLARDSDLEHVTIKFDNLIIKNINKNVDEIRGKLAQFPSIVKDYILCYFNQGGFSVLSQDALQKRAVPMSISFGSVYNSKNNSVTQELIINNDGSVTCIETIELYCMTQAGRKPIDSDTPLAMLQTVTVIDVENGKIKHDLISDHCYVLDKRVQKLFQTNTELKDEKMLAKSKSHKIKNQSSNNRYSNKNQMDGSELSIDESNDLYCDYANNEVTFKIGKAVEVRKKLDNTVATYRKDRCNPRVIKAANDTMNASMNMIGMAGAGAAVVSFVCNILRHVFSDSVGQSFYKGAMSLFGPSNDFQYVSITKRNVDNIREQQDNLNEQYEAIQSGLLL